MPGKKTLFSWTNLSLFVGVFTAGMVGWFTYNLWFNHVSFSEHFAPQLAVVDYGSNVRARWIANRIIPYGVVMLVAVLLKEYKVVGYLLLMRVGVDIFDGFVLTLSYFNNANSPDMNKTMIGAYLLSLPCLFGGWYLIRKYPGPRP
ncbi:MAG: hypothetical protein ACRDEB_06020 [Chitinophagaceae bacterium]